MESDTKEFEFVAVKEESDENVVIDGVVLMKEFDYVEEKQEQPEDSETSDLAASWVPNTSGTVLRNKQRSHSDCGQNTTTPTETISSTEYTEQEICNTDPECGHVMYGSTAVEEVNASSDGRESERGETSGLTYTCDSCLRDFSSKNTLISHVFIHIDGILPPSHICKLCGEVFSNAFCLIKHFLRHQGKRSVAAVAMQTDGNLSEKQWFSEICQKIHRLEHGRGIFASADNVDKSNVEWYCKCKICGKLFNEWWNLRNRRIYKYKWKKSYSCESSEKLKVRQYKPAESYLWLCDICGKSFSCPSILETHMHYHTVLQP